MKTIIKVLLLSFPILMFSQTSSDTINISKEVKEISVEVVKKRKAVDSIKELKNKEIIKQLKIIALIKRKIEEIKLEKKIKHLDKNLIVSFSDTLYALKPRSEPEYWEIIPRNWIGRRFHEDDYRIRKYKYINNEKVYLD